MSIVSTSVRYSLIRTNERMWEMKNVGRRRDGVTRRRKMDRNKRRSFELRGRVIRGDGLGCALGYPTANLTRHYFHYHHVPDGVYFGFVNFGASRPPTRSLTGLPALAIVGVNKKVEVYILNWHKILYGRYLRMELIKKIRPLRSFTSPGALKSQIKKDIIVARRILSYQKNNF